MLFQRNRKENAGSGDVREDDGSKFLFAYPQGEWNRSKNSGAEVYTGVRFLYENLYYPSR